MKPMAQSFVAAIRNAPTTVWRTAAILCAQQIDPQVRVTKLNFITSFKFSDGSEARTQPQPRSGGLYAYTPGSRRGPIHDPEAGVS